MYPEIIDICESYNTLSGVEGKSDIREFYMADTLLSLPSKEHYYELVKKAVYSNSQEAHAGYITAMTKAHFKDGAVEHAMKFFEGEVAKLRDIKQKREDTLIALFDSAYEGDAEMTFEQYKDRYLDVIQISENLVRESFAVGILRRVIADKQYEEVDNLFQLYLV